MRSNPFGTKGALIHPCGRVRSAEGSSPHRELSPRSDMATLPQQGAAPLAPLTRLSLHTHKNSTPAPASVLFLRVLLSYPGGDEISIEECRDEVDTVYRRLMNPIEESVESKLMWEENKKYLHKLTPKECEVMISLYVDHLSVRETAAKLKVDDSTVSTHHKNARDKIRNAMEE